MAFQSPYRGEESPLGKLSPLARERVSRGAMVVVAVVLIYFSIRGLAGLTDIQQHAATQPVGNYHGRRSGAGFFPWLTVIGTGLLGAMTLAAALLPVSTMQSIFERYNRPPVTGDRSPDTDDRYWPIFSRRWWWPW